MRKSFKSLFALCTVFMMVLGMSVTAYAAGEVDKEATVKQFIIDTTIVNDDGSLRYTNNTVKAYVSEKADEEHTQAVTLGDGKTIVYYDPNVIDIIYRQAQKYYENEMVGNKLDDLTNNLTIEADTGAAATMLSGFTPIIELIIGIIVVLITFGMALFSAFDICYIAFPIFRNKMEDVRQSENPIGTKKSVNGEVSLRWVTDDAQYAITQGTIDSGKSPWVLYFQKRVMSYIFLGIILFILLTGNITIITELAINVVAGIIDIISSLAS